MRTVFEDLRHTCVFGPPLLALSTGNVPGSLKSELSLLAAEADSFAASKSHDPVPETDTLHRPLAESTLI